MANKIDDFGEKIGGAKKDLWRDRSLTIDDIQDMTEREIFKYVKKDNIWKKPDYKKMVEDGIAPETVFLIKKIRDSFPAAVKPTGNSKKDKENISKYISLTEIVRDKIMSIKDNDGFSNLFDSIFKDNGYYSYLANNYGRWTEKADGHPGITNKFVKAVQIKSYDIVKAKRQVAETGFPETVEAWRKNIKITERGDKWSIVKKVSGYRYEILGEGFETKDEAEEYLNTKLKEELKRENKRVKIERPQLEHIERTGEDYRHGRDITTEEFMNTFGFRGGEFGNWTNNLDRQQCLNMAYDALMDLSDVLKLNPRVISLNGELGIAFGARGSGSALAHYEPNKIVINLTKMRGAGSLAHEWAHALDDFFGRLSGDKVITSPFVSEGINLKTSKLNPKTIDAWKDLMNTILKRELTKEEIISNLNKDINMTKKSLQTWLKSTRQYLESEQSMRKGVRRKATEDELKTADKLMDEIINGKDRSDSFEKLKELHKSIKGIQLENTICENINACVFWLNHYDKDLLNSDTIKKISDSEYYKNASQIDKRRSKVYWSTKPELFARAFESYVQDVINNNGFKSDYLVHGTKAAFVEYKPYPLGEERKKLYEAFQKFTDNLQELKQYEIIREFEMEKTPERMTLEDYAEQYQKDYENVLEKINGLDAFKAENSNGDYVTVTKSIKEFNKLQITYFQNDEPVSDRQLSNMNEAADRLALGGYNNIVEKIEYTVKAYGNIPYEELQELPGKNYVIRTTEDKLEKIKDMEINYTVFNRNGQCSLIVKNNDKIRAMEALGLRDKEIGRENYSTIKSLEGSNRYIRVTVEELDKLKGTDIKYAAFDKGEYINVVVKDSDFNRAAEAIGSCFNLQVGNTKYSEIKNMPGEKCYKVYNKEQIKRLNEVDVKYAAFDKGNGKYKVVFSQKELTKVNSILKTEREIHKSYDIER